MFIINRFYRDEGTEYAYRRLCDALNERGVGLSLSLSPFAVFPDSALRPQADFVLFWDKDIAAAKKFEAQGLRVFNRAAAIEICDNKLKTYAALDGVVSTVPTLGAPFIYDVNSDIDEAFTAQAEEYLGYPMVFKLAVGSLGRQVALINNRAQFLRHRKKYLHVPHLFQRYIPGADVRIYVVGGRTVAAIERMPQEGDFRANRAVGGSFRLVSADKSLQDMGQTISRTIGLDYFAADFMIADRPYLLEVNSNAYFKSAEDEGADIAGAYARYILSELNGTHGG